MKLGFIGQGFIGKSYADDYEARGFQTVRYALEPQYEGNRDALKECDAVLIAVPTPTTPNGFDVSILKSVLSLVGDGKVAVIKSTIIPGTTRKLQAEFPNIVVMHSPEFLSSATAAYEAAHPNRNIIGVVNDKDRARADEIIKTFAPAPYNLVCTAEEAEVIKYSRNIAGFMRILFYNLAYDVAAHHGATWDVIADAVAHDPDNGPLYTKPVHKSGRGAGGHCFIKDMAAFVKAYEAAVPGDTEGLAFLNAAVLKNLALLKDSGKDQEFVRSVYGS